MKRVTKSSMLFLVGWVGVLGAGYVWGGSCGNCLCIQYEFENNAGTKLGFSTSKTDATQTVSNAYGGASPNWGVTCLESPFGETNNQVFVFSYGTLTYPCDMPAGINPPYVQEASGGTTPAYFSTTNQGACNGT